MNCAYYITINGQKHKLFESGNSVTSLAELKFAFKQYLTNNNSAEIKNLIDELKSFSDFKEVNINDITENSVGVFTPAELISNLDSNRFNIYNALNIKSKNQNNVIIGFGDETVPTKFYNGHIFLNLNYIDNKSNNLIALTELAFSENLSKKEYENLDFAKLVNTPGNEEKIDNLLNRILVGDPDKINTLKSKILTAYYKAQVIEETGSRNYNTERAAMKTVWDKYQVREDFNKLYTNPIEIRVEDLKQGDYVVIPSKNGTSTEIFYDYYINMDNQYMLRLIKYDKDKQSPFLITRPASKYSPSQKGLQIKENSVSVQAYIHSPEVYENYSYPNNISYVEIPVKSGRTHMKYEWIRSLVTKPNTKVTIHGLDHSTINYKIKKFSGQIVTLENGEEININSINNLTIAAPNIKDGLEYQIDYKTPSIGENIRVIYKDKERIGQVIGYDYINDKVTYIYKNDSGEYKTTSTNIKNITATAVPQDTNINWINQLDLERINKYVQNKLNEAISISQSVKNNLEKHGLNLENLTYNVEEVSKFTSLKKGDILYDPTLSYGSKIFKVVENVTRNIKGENIYLIKTITNDGQGNLVYLNIPREALGKYLLFTNRINNTFATMGIQKNRFELFSNNDNDSPEYTPVKVYQNPNGFIFTLNENMNPKESTLYESGTKDITKQYAEELKKRYKWTETPKILYARHEKTNGISERKYKKDTLNTVYLNFNNDYFSNLIGQDKLTVIVPGSFITFKGDTDAYIIEKVFKDSLLVSKYVYTKTGNSLNDNLEYVKCEKFYLTPDTQLEIAGIHVPKWAQEEYNVLNEIVKKRDPKYKNIENIKKSVDYEFTQADNKEMLVTLSQHLEDKFGIKINLIHNSELSQFDNPEVYKAKAFVNKDEIFVNIDKASLAEPLHEVLHLVLATMKAKNPDLYYSLVRSVQNHPMFENVAKDYDEINTELLEETFIKLFSLTFRNNVLRTGVYDEVVFDKAIKDTISDLLDLRENLDWEDSFDLMGKPIKDILIEFGSSLISGDTSLIDKNSVYMMFDISNTIRTLLHDGNLEQKCSN